MTYQCEGCSESFATLSNENFKLLEKEVSGCRFSRMSQGHCFGDAGEVISVDTIPHGQTINSDLHIPTLKTLQEHF